MHALGLLFDAFIYSPTMNVPFEVAYVQVCEDDGSPVELPVEEDKTLLLSTLTAQFPRATGLKYQSETGCMRGVRLSDGRLFPPPDGWQNRVYQIVVVNGNCFGFGQLYCFFIFAMPRLCLHFKYFSSNHTFRKGIFLSRR